MSDEIALLKAENASLRRTLGLVKRVASEADIETPDEMGSLNIDHATRLLILEALQRTNGNRTLAASLLGIARSTIFTMMKKHHIKFRSSVRMKTKDYQIEGLVL